MCSFSRHLPRFFTNDCGKTIFGNWKMKSEELLHELDIPLSPTRRKCATLILHTFQQGRKLLNSNAFGKISGLIYLTTKMFGNKVCKQMEWYGCKEWSKYFKCLWYGYNTINKLFNFVITFCDQCNNFPMSLLLFPQYCLQF